jgi:FixJ family two-component response regulator
VLKPGCFVTPVVFLPGMGSIELAVKAMKAGAERGAS